jgi:hypothetical protein
MLDFHHIVLLISERTSVKQKYVTHRARPRRLLPRTRVGLELDSRSGTQSSSNLAAAIVTHLDTQVLDIGVYSAKTYASLKTIRSSVCYMG